jgi:hypothetical protein
MQTAYTVKAGDTVAYKGPSLSDAARAWDGATFDKACVTPGGIEVQTWDERGIMVRDGWILHVDPDGTVYLNPSVGA